MSGEYKDWLHQQYKACEELVKLLRQCKLDGMIKSQPNQPPYVKLLLPDKTVDLFIKTVNTEYAKSIWLCKECELKTKTMYLLYIKYENSFLIASGNEVDRECELKNSDWKQDKMVVVEKELFHDAKTFFEMLYLKYERKKQTRLTSF